MNSTLQTVTIVLILCMNVIAFCAMGLDKKRAAAKKWRIPEKRLFLYSILGGATGGTLGMFLFRHKTKHWYFKIFFPLLMIIQLLLYFYLILSMLN